MIAAERQQKIVEALGTQTFLSLAQLAALLNVSVMTIRRDVAELSSRGQILAVRGGVKPLAASSAPVSTYFRSPSLLRAALNQLGDSRIIFLDGGAVCHELALYIPWREDMTVVTNDFEIAHYIISHSPARLYFIGGELRRSDHTFHRRIAQETLMSLSFELLFLAPEKWSARGVWHHEEHRQRWYQMLIAASGKSVLLAKSQHYGQSGLFHLYSLEQADVILTDHAPAGDLTHGLIAPGKLHILRD